MITLAAESQALRRGAADFCVRRPRNEWRPGAIRELMAAYALSPDAGDIDECVNLFTEDAEFLVYGRSFEGHEGIGGMFREAPNGLHLTGVSRIDVDGDTATARSQVLFVRAGTSNCDSALYDDELVRARGDWLFRRRRCRFITTGGLVRQPRGSATMTRVALVTGAAGGQGWAIVERLRAQGLLRGGLRPARRRPVRRGRPSWATTR